MTAPMTPDEARLRELAEAATPGPRHAVGGYLTVRDPDGSFSNTIYHLDELGQKGPLLPYQAVPFAKDADARFYAAASPSRILALLDALSAERERGDRAVETLGLLDSWKSIMPVTVQRIVRKGLATQKAEGAET